MRLSVRPAPPSFNVPALGMRLLRRIVAVTNRRVYSISVILRPASLAIMMTRKGGAVVGRGELADEARGMGATPEEVLAFWFGREGKEGYGEFREVWFSRDPEFDREIRDRFEAVYEEAVAGGLEVWKEEARSCLALIVVLDQFPRNMFRGDARMYTADGLALAAARHAVERAYDRELPPFQRLFVYLPFEHSENLEDQRSSMELFRGLSGEIGSDDLLTYAVRHSKIVERFGRFPHRNEILDRRTTPEEAEFLEEPGSSF
jgi:uncharacterized protein (DUF924 family)